MNEERYFSVREISRIAGKSEETVRRWIWGGKLPATKLGGQLFVAGSELAKVGLEEPPRDDTGTPLLRDTAVMDTGLPLLRETAVMEYNASRRVDMDTKAEALAVLEKAREYRLRMAAKYGAEDRDIAELIRDSHEDEDKL